MIADVLIRGAKRFDNGDVVDVVLAGGVIRQIGRAGGVTAVRTIDAAGLLLSPGFVDAHVHLDKTRSLGDEESPTLAAAIQNYSAFYRSIPAGQLNENMKRRATATLRAAVAAGTTAVRSHVNLEGEDDLASIEAIAELKRELAAFIDIKISCLPNFYGPDDVIERRFASMRQAIERGLIDFVGGSPHMAKHRPDLTRLLFELAVAYGLPLDLHTDERDDPDISTFLETIALTKQYGYQGKVTCGHVTALAAVSDAVAAEAIAAAREAGIHIITLPSCNLYLMGRTDRQPIRRGVTRIREFLDAGVNIAYASDNILDPFRPLGNADMLEEGLLGAQVAQMVTSSELERVFRMGTVNAAAAMQLDDYGLAPGKRADLVLLEADSAADALIRQAVRRYVIKNGHVVATNEVKKTLAF